MENNTEEHMSYATLTIDPDKFLKEFSVKKFRDYMEKETKYETRDEEFKETFDRYFELLQTWFDKAKKEQEGEISNE